MILGIETVTLARYIALRLFESVMFALLLNRTLERRINSKVIHTICFTLTLTVLQILKGMIPKPIPILSVPLNYLPDILVVRVFYRGNWILDNVLCTVSFYSSMFLGDVIGYVVSVAAGVMELGTFDNIEDIPLFTSVLSRAVLPFTNIAIIKLYGKLRPVIARPLQVLTPPILLCVLFMAFFPVGAGSLYNTCPTLYYAVFAALAVMLVYAVYRLLLQADRERRLQTDIERRKMQEDYYNALYKESERLKGIYHDMEFHHDYLSQTTDKDYLNTLKERIRGTMIDTGKGLV